MKFSSAFVVVAFMALGALPAAAQQAGDACAANDPPVCDSASDGLLFCSESLVLEAQGCGEFVPGASCGTLPCSGTDCGQLSVGCVSGRGDSCLGISPLFNDNDEDDQLLMFSPCAAGSVCAMTTSAETCIAPPAGITACTASSPPTRCVGDTFVLCVGYSDVDATIATPGILPCGDFDLVCNEDTGCAEPEPASDPRCGSGGTGNGSCVNNVAHQCSEGVVQSSQDCSNSGLACIVEGGSPSCVSADPACGPSGVGVCDGNVATICVGGDFLNTTDCSSIGRVCGPVDGNGQIGCAVGGNEGEGEGEGEGEPGEGEGEPGREECSSDDDCEDDETCEDGECERERGGRGREQEEEKDAGLFTCANSGGTLPLGLGVVALVLRRRRRR